MRGAAAGVVDAVEVADEAGCLDVVAEAVPPDVARLRPEPGEAHPTVLGVVGVGEGVALLGLEVVPHTVAGVPLLQAVADGHPRDRANGQVGGGEGAVVVHYIWTGRLDALQPVRVLFYDNVARLLGGGEIGPSRQVAVEDVVHRVPEPVFRHGHPFVRVGDCRPAGTEVADEHAVVMDRHAIETRGKRTVGTHVESRRGVEEEDCHGQRRSECLVPPVVDLRGDAAFRSYPEPAVLVADDAACVLVGRPHLHRVNAPAVQGELVLAADPKAQSLGLVAGTRSLADDAA